MQIEEVVRSCSNDLVAYAAVASIGRHFLSEVSDRAMSYDMSVGAFTALSVDRFCRHGDEGEMRSVIEAMRGAPAPVLAGLHRILCIMLAASGGSDEKRRRDRTPCMVAQLCAMEADRRRDIHA